MLSAAVLARELASELANDPAALGYGALLATGNLGAVADALNEVRAGIAVRRGVVQGYEILNAIVVADLTALTQIQLARLTLLCSASGGVDTAGDGTRALLAAMFGPSTTSRANLIALADRAGSRAEALFGVGTRVTHLDVARAIGRR